jgi:hypothetical protein
LQIRGLQNVEYNPILDNFLNVELKFVFQL